MAQRKSGVSVLSCNLVALYIESASDKIKGALNKFKGPRAQKVVIYLRTRVHFTVTPKHIFEDIVMKLAVQSLKKCQQRNVETIV